MANFTPLQCWLLVAVCIWQNSDAQNKWWLELLNTRQHILNGKVILKTAIWIYVFQCNCQKQFYLKKTEKLFSFVIMKKSDLIYLYSSSLLIQFIFWIKIPGWKASYWQRCNKHSQAAAQLITFLLNLLDCSVMRNEYKVCVCLCSCTSMRARLCASSVAQPCVLQLLSVILSLYQLPTGFSEMSHSN